jgi:putative Holliday junction resolvase
MGKLFGLDYGTKRVGLASCSKLLKIPTPFETFVMDKTPEASSKRLADILKKEDCELIVVGLPLELSGREGPMAQMTRAFIDLLKSHLDGITIVFLDERLTSAQAEKAMMGLEFNRKKRAQNSDALAACLILETYLSTQNL